MPLCSRGSCLDCTYNSAAMGLSLKFLDGMLTPENVLSVALFAVLESNTTDDVFYDRNVYQVH